MRLPRFIAICGHPKSGKSLVQAILEDRFGVMPIDDGAPLREFAMQNLGLTREQVSTQEGKAEFIEILGRRWQVREILGILGNHIEAMFGPHAFPMIAMKRIELEEASARRTLENVGADPVSPFSYSFGSVRRDQGRAYQAQGGIVIGLKNPLAPPSPYEFDRFDPTVVDFWINNDALARGLPADEAKADLEAKLLTLFGPH